MYGHAQGGLDLSRFVLERLGDADTGALLDQGSGGIYAAALAGLRPGWWGVEAAASASLGPGPGPGSGPGAHPAVLAESDRLPFPTAAFAAVVAAVGSAVGSPAAELARVTARGGRVLVVADGRDHLASLRALVDEASGGPLLSRSCDPRVVLEEAAPALGPHLVVERVDRLTDEIVVSEAGPVLTYVRGLRPRLEPQLRGFTGWTVVLARVRAALEEALARDGWWTTTVHTGVLVCRPADH